MSEKLVVRYPRASALACIESLENTYQLKDEGEYREDFIYVKPKQWRISIFMDVGEMALEVWNENTGKFDMTEECDADISKMESFIAAHQK